MSDRGHVAHPLRRLLPGVLLALASAASAELAPEPNRAEITRYRFVVDLSLGSEIAGVAYLSARCGGETLALDLVSVDPQGGGMRVAGVERLSSSPHEVRDPSALPGTAVGHRHLENRLLVLESCEPARNDSPEARPATELHLRVRYQGQPRDGLVRSADRDRPGWFSDHWPDRARHWIPVVDHPGVKAPVTFDVIAPAEQQVVASGELVETVDLPGGRRRWRWRSEAPLATKVMALAAAPFAAIRRGTASGVPLSLWLDPERAATALPELAAAGDILTFFVDRLGAFPYPELAVVQSATRYGGMENAGAIFLADRVVGDGRDDGPLLAHEIAHQWFGDAVTESDWDHLWLSEGFATYLTALWIEHREGPEAFRREMARSRRAVIALEAERRASSGSLPVVRRADDPAEMLDGLVYRKGAWVLHMLRERLGTAALWRVLREVQRRFAHGTASTDDFQRVVEAVTGEDLDGFFRQWLRRAGHPRLEVDWRWSSEAGAIEIRVRQVQTGDAFAFPLEIGLEGADAKPLGRRMLQVDAAEETFRWTVDAPPSGVVLDPHVVLLAEGLERGEGR